MYAHDIHEPYTETSWNGLMILSILSIIAILGYLGMQFAAQR
jgi:hypothetical protein